MAALEFLQRRLAVLGHIGGLAVLHQRVGLLAIGIVLGNHGIGLAHGGVVGAGIAFLGRGHQRGIVASRVRRRCRQEYWLEQQRQKHAHFSSGAQFAFGTCPSILSEFATTATRP